MRILDTSKEWVAVVECCGTGFEESGCGKSLLADIRDLKFDRKDPGILFIVCSCGVRNIVHVSEALKDAITHTMRWCEASHGEYKFMALRIDQPIDGPPN
ncbi:MAG: hypothetical protein Q8P49_02275 [Candidatus Liptonbacteria bacterium]|nr:hypothetical protein [Candidatus Liptonbacteria bacterium]